MRSYPAAALTATRSAKAWCYRSSSQGAEHDLLPSPHTFETPAQASRRHDGRVQDAYDRTRVRPLEAVPCTKPLHEGVGDSSTIHGREHHHGALERKETWRRHVGAASARWADQHRMQPIGRREQRGALRETLGAFTEESGGNICPESGRPESGWTRPHRALSWPKVGATATILHAEAGASRSAIGSAEPGPAGSSPENPVPLWIMAPAAPMASTLVLTRAA